MFFGLIKISEKLNPNRGIKKANKLVICIWSIKKIVIKTKVKIVKTDDDDFNLNDRVLIIKSQHPISENPVTNVTTLLNKVEIIAYLGDAPNIVNGLMLIIIGCSKYPCLKRTTLYPILVANNR